MTVQQQKGHHQAAAPAFLGQSSDVSTRGGPVCDPSGRIMSWKPVQVTEEIVG